MTTSLLRGGNPLRDRNRAGRAPSSGCRWDCADNENVDAKADEPGESKGKALVKGHDKEAQKQEKEARNAAKRKEEEARNAGKQKGAHEGEDKKGKGSKEGSQKD